MPSTTLPEEAEHESAAELRRFYTLIPAYLELLTAVRGEQRRLALALQLVWARAERRFIADPSTTAAGAGLCGSATGTKR